MDDTKKLTFENVNKINGEDTTNLSLSRINAQRLSELKIELKKSGCLTKSAAIVIEKDCFKW